MGRKQFVKDGPRPAENDIGQSCAMRTKHGACFAKKVNLLGNGETSRHNHPDTLRLQKPYQRLFIFRRSVGTVGACDIQNLRIDRRPVHGRRSEAIVELSAPIAKSQRRYCRSGIRYIRAVE